jgi:hypothetical protein
VTEPRVTIVTASFSDAGLTKRDLTVQEQQRERRERETGACVCIIVSSAEA